MALKITVQVDTTVPSGGRIRIVNQSVTGPPGTNGVGVPAGGTTGQALVKSSNTNYATTWSTISSGAPTTAQYVTLATDGTLTNERVLTAGTGITVTDAGAGSTVTVATSAILPTIIDAKGDLIVGTAADTAARLAVGADRAVLTADAAVTGGMKWQQPMSDDQPRINPVSGALYLPRHMGTTMNLSTTLFGVQGFTLTKAATLQQIRLRVTAGVAGNATLAIYDSTAAGAPNTRLATATVDVSSIGFKTGSFSLALAPGTYWVGALASNATATVYGVTQSSNEPAFVGYPRNEGNWSNNAAYGCYYFVAAVAGTPTVSPTWLFARNAAPVITYDLGFA